MSATEARRSEYDPPEWWGEDVIDVQQRAETQELLARILDAAEANKPLPKGEAELVRECVAYLRRTAP